jgi:hypothetical protein
LGSGGKLTGNPERVMQTSLFNETGQPIKTPGMRPDGYFGLLGGHRETAEHYDALPFIPVCL